MQNGVNHVYSLNKSLERVEYPAEGVAQKDHIKVALKRSYFAPCKSFVENKNFIDKGSESSLFGTFTFCG